MPDRRIRVLLADDHDRLRAVVRNLLEPEFDVVGDVADGASALDATARLDPDVMVLDIGMPDLDGFEVARRLGQARERPHIVFMSVHDDAAFERQARAVGGAAYVVKSRMHADLGPALREAVRGSPR